MNQQQLSLLKLRLVAACDGHLANGGKIIHTYFYKEEGKCKCPLSCLDINLDLQLADTLTQQMGFPITNEEIWSFIWSFDQGKPKGKDQSMSELGAELRAKYLPEMST